VKLVSKTLSNPQSRSAVLSSNVSAWPGGSPKHSPMAARGLGAYEQALMVKIAEFRGSGYKPVHKSLIALAEAYPGFGAHGAYTAVMEGIKEAEDKIAGAKDSYLNAATAYNTRLERLPDRLLLRLGLFKPAPVKDFAI